MQNCMLQGCDGTGGMSLSVGVDKCQKGSTQTGKISILIQPFCSFLGEVQRKVKWLLFIK